MAKNIDYLNTGNSGVEPTFGNEEASTEQQEAVSEQQRQIAELMPSAQKIIDTCDAEIEAIADIRSYITKIKARNNLTDEQKAQAILNMYDAREMYVELVQRLKTSIAEQVHTAETEAKK